MTQVSKVGMISANLSGWNQAARYWRGTPAAPIAEQDDPKTQQLLERHEGLVAELESLERTIETQAQILVRRAAKMASEKQPRTAAILSLRHKDTAVHVGEPTRRQLWPALIVVLLLAAATLAVVTLRGGNEGSGTLDLRVIPLDSPENPYTAVSPAVEQEFVGLGTPASLSASSVVQAGAVADATSALNDEGVVGRASPTIEASARVIPVVVQAGESITYFAEAYGTRVETIVRINGLDDSALIFTEQTLLIPLGWDY